MRRPDFETIRLRLEQAGHLVASCADEIAGWRPENVGEEIRRRDLELVARGIGRWCKDVVRILVMSRIPIEIERCPHCGWSRAPRSVPRCPRCNGPREVRDETGRATLGRTA